jgi:ABC-2 type transport system permease protein
MNALTGTPILIRLVVRRDRYRIVAYVLGLAALQAGMLAARGLDPQQALVDETIAFASNPALRMFGVASGASVGATMSIRGYFLLAVLAALMSSLAVVRNSRHDEETGRAELVGAAVVGRHASLAAALIVGVTTNLTLAMALGLAGLLAGEPAAGSFTAGLAVAGLGILFGGVAAATAQLSSTTRGANGLAAAALGGAFVVSGVGNVLGEVDRSGLRLVSAWPAWLSPVGWGQQMRPFGGNQLEPLALFALGFVALVLLAGLLQTRRDVGRGILAERRGQADARPALLSPFGLGWRLQRGTLIGWAGAMAGFGILFGAIIDQIVSSSGATTEWYARMGGSEVIVDAYRASVVEMAGMAVAIYAVQVVLRMHAEEAEGRLEPVLSASVSRSRWMASQLLTALLGATVLLLLFAVGMALAAGAVLGDTTGQLGSLIVAALVQLPAVLVLGAVAVAATVLVPRLAGAVSWVAVTLSVLIGPLFGAATLQLPQWVQDLSPFTHVPKVPGAALSALPVVLLVVIAVALAAAAVAVFRRRDLALPA